ncbi:hypothetical protein [Streptomyces lydicus]|uniref:hypothetical protein n=1 Tax=Streptomyces lydicus TaxID=47763 RepID=UPI0037B79851
MSDEQAVPHAKGPAPVGVSHDVLLESVKTQAAALNQTFGQLRSAPATVREQAVRTFTDFSMFDGIDVDWEYPGTF